ncbi:hypothetical protein [Haliovirga abyssi]|uniref:Helicase XPB/Ssl2 N-terminal domain-containing protein n=1 Tax=Haliovirga abyssi TaxID=2996794 RepID=A0AAU9DXZ3_9FUSO|nr:hypothetical protein [Haliovirga abyssi]BDU51376.1 hypothetical protein HLVA_19450 [Haliovirga abyssi]
MESRKEELLKLEIMKNYEFKELKTLYELYFKKCINKGYIKSDLKDKMIYMRDREKLVDIMFQFYTKKDVFNNCLKDMPKQVRMIFKLICFNIAVDISVLKETYKIDVIDKKKKERYSYLSDPKTLLKKGVEFFKIVLYRKFYYGEISGMLTLPQVIRIAITENLEEKPLHYDLVPLEKVESKYIKNFEIELLKNYLLYVNIQKSGLIKKSVSGKILKKSIVDFKNRTNMEELYEGNKKLEYYKSKLILEFIDFANFNKEEYGLDAKEGIKKLVTDIFEDKLNYNGLSKKINLLDFILTHIKGMRYYFDENNLYKQFMEKLFKILRKFKKEFWIDVTNIYDTLIYKNENVDLIDVRLSANLYMMVEEGQPYARYKDKHYIENGILYMNYITIPFIKGVLVLLASFGVFEIAYDEFENKKGFEDESRDFLGNTEFDNIKYVKLTKLGEYVFGLRDDYEIQTKEDVKIELDTKRLVINFKGEDNLKKVFIESIADKIGENMYKVDFDSIFRNVLNAEDMKNNIQNFKNYIEKDLPENWKIFFENLEKRLNPIVETTEYKVFEIDKNKELIKLLTKDSYLKKYILKAEDYKILVKNKDINRVKKKLKEYGFYMD